MIKKYLFFIMVLITSCAIKAQTVITLEKTGGVYKIPCVINGLKLKLIFDTGASSVCISESLASMMLENGYLSENDIKGTSQSQVADGRIVNNTNINIKKLEIGDKVLNNVEAVVIEGQSAPLLLGQTAIRRLGKYSISGDKLIIGSGIINTKNKTNHTHISPLDSLIILSDALNFYMESAYSLAIEKYQILYDNDMLSCEEAILYGNCFYNLNNELKALDIYLEIEETESMFLEKHPRTKGELFEKGKTLYELEDYTPAITYLNRARYYVEKWSLDQKSIILTLCMIHKEQDNKFMAELLLNEYIQQYLDYMEIKAVDCWDKCYRDSFLAELYYWRALFSTDDYDLDKYYIISAAWGNKKAIESCKKYELKYTSKPYRYEY